MRLIKVLLLSAVATLLMAGPALACGGLVAPNGSVNLVKTTTLAAYARRSRALRDVVRVRGGRWRQVRIDRAAPRQYPPT